MHVYALFYVLLSKWRFKKNEGHLRWRYNLSSSSVKLPTDALNFFFFVSSDIRAERSWITSRFAQTSKIVASLTLYCRAMLRLLGGFVWLNLEINSNLCGSFKRLALPGIICRGVMRGERGRQVTMGAPYSCGGRGKIQTMSQVLYSTQYICFGKTSISNMGAPNFLPRALSNLVTPLIICE